MLKRRSDTQVRLVFHKNVFQVRSLVTFRDFGCFQPRRGVMSRFFSSFCRRIGMPLLCLELVCSAIAWSQQPATYSRSTAIDQANSRAEHEAEQMVSLSADRILSILRQEPGLLLQVKKELVRKAFEQGRILDPNDLTDDALFTLIRQDDNIRVIATHEIVDRAYVKAKPTREELARDLPCRQLMPTGPETVANKQLDQSASNTTSVKRPPSQEEEYWLKHENDLDCYLTQYLPYGTVPYSYGQPQNAQSPSQQQYPASGYPRQQYPQQQYPQQYPQQQYPPSQIPQQGPSTTTDVSFR